MANTRSSALANTYLIPQSPVAQPAPKQQFQDEIGAPEEGLAMIDGTTSQYFDKWAALKGFAREVWENYGIDVRYPDPSVPESNRLHRIYLKSIADLKHQGAKLKTDQTMYNSMLQREDNIMFDPTKEHASDQKPGTDFVRSKLDDIVLQANDKLQQQFYDKKSLDEAKAYYNKVKADLLKNAETDPQNKNYWLRQVQGLTDPTSAAKQFAPQREPASRDRDNERTMAAGAFLKKTESLRNGTADSYKLSDSIFERDEEGNPIRAYVSTDMAGDTYAGKEVVRFEYYPELQKTKLVLRAKTADKTGAKAVESIDLSTSDPMSVAKGFTSENTRYAANGEFLDIYANESGLFKPTTGEVDPSTLITPDAQQRYGKMSKDIEADRENATKVIELKDEIAAMKSSDEKGLFDWTHDRVTKVDGNGIPIKIAKTKDGYKIENIMQIAPGKTPAFYKKYKTMGKQALLNFLTSRDVHLGPKERSAPQQAGTQVAPQQQSGLTAEEAKRLEDLKKKYKF